MVRLEQVAVRGRSAGGCPKQHTGRVDSACFCHYSERNRLAPPWVLNALAVSGMFSRTYLTTSTTGTR